MSVRMLQIKEGGNFTFKALPCKDSINNNNNNNAGFYYIYLSFGPAYGAPTGQTNLSWCLGQTF